MTSQAQNDLRSTLTTLWQQLSANPHNRALAVANMLWHRDEPALKHLFADQIARQTPLGEARTEALKLLAREPLITAQPLVVQPSPAPEMTYLRVDPEMGRLSVALECAAEFRLWIIGREITRTQQGSGVITKAELWERLARYNIDYTRRHFDRLLAQGQGVFWHIHKRKLYLGSIVKVGRRLSCQAVESGMELGHNLPGVRQVLLDVFGSLEQWEAMLYAGWIASRSQREMLLISREKLSELFNRCAITIRRWEQSRLKAIIAIRTNYAQCGDVERYIDSIPEHARGYVARVLFDGKVQDIVRLQWQLPNSYSVVIDHHPHKGQASKVRKAVNADLPADTQRGGYCRRYLPSAKALTRRNRSLKFRMGLMGDVNQPVYVYLGNRRRSKWGIYEITDTGFVFTHANERVSRKRERQVLRALWGKRQAFIQQWRSQKGEI